MHLHCERKNKQVNDYRSYIRNKPAFVFSGFLSKRAALHAYITAMIIHLFILSSAVQMYEFLYIHFLGTFTFLGEQGWRSGESARLPPMWPGFDSRSRRHMWVEFVVGSRPCSERFFSGYSGFPLSSKTNISKFQFDLESVPN